MTRVTRCQSQSCSPSSQRQERGAVTRWSGRSSSHCLQPPVTASVNPKPFRVRVASPWLPRHIVPSVSLARPPPPPGCCRVGGSQNEPLLCQSPKSGRRERSPAGGYAGPPPAWGRERTWLNPTRARRPGRGRRRRGPGRGLVPAGWEQRGPRLLGPGASPPPLRPGSHSARPGDPAPTGSASSPPAPSRVLTLLPGATCHPRNP